VKSQKKTLMQTHGGVSVRNFQLEQNKKRRKNHVPCVSALTHVWRFPIIHR